VRSSVRHHAGWDPSDVAPDACIASCAAPVLFVCATDDTFIEVNFIKWNCTAL